jgi:hypothetical protein
VSDSDRQRGYLETSGFGFALVDEDQHHPVWRIDKALRRNSLPTITVMSDVGGIPELSTWAMMALSFAGYRRARTCQVTLAASPSLVAQFGADSGLPDVRGR